MQNFIECYQFVFIPGNLKWFQTKYLKEFVYTTKFCSTRDNLKGKTDLARFFFKCPKKGTSLKDG